MVLSTHGGFFHTRKYSLLKQLYYRTALPVVLARYAAIIANSDADFAMVRGLHRNAVRIDNAIDFDDFAEVPDTLEDLPYFVYVGRFSENKRLDRLLATFQKLAETGTSFRLVLAGPRSAETQESLHRYLDASGISDKVDLHLDPDQSELKDILARSTYFTLASEYEGFGLAAVEAMAAGRLVLLNRIKPLIDFVDDGQNGFLVDFARPTEAAAQIYQIMRLPKSIKQEIATRARARAREFSWSDRIREFGKVYESVLWARGGSLAEIGHRR